MGWLQQGVALGQFCGPPIVAWVATYRGSWKMTGVVPAVFALVGILVAMRLGRRFSQVQAIKKAPQGL
jgi:MFS family permease